LKTVVVSAGEKADVICQVGIRKASASESSLTCRNRLRWHQNRGIESISGWVWRVPTYWPGGVRHEDDASLICGFRVEQEKACPDTPCSVWSWGQGASQAVTPQGIEYRRRARRRTGP